MSYLEPIWNILSPNLFSFCVLVIPDSCSVSFGGKEADISMTTWGTVTRFGPRICQIGPKWDIRDFIQIRFSISGSASQNVLNMI